jgi:hypothetical protein
MHKQLNLNLAELTASQKEAFDDHKHREVSDCTFFDFSRGVPE